MWRRSSSFSTSRREGGTEYVTRGIGGGGSGKHQRLPMQGILDQREDLTLKTQLARGDDGGSIAVIRAVGDERPRALERNRNQG